jgi:hypothetical protein
MPGEWCAIRLERKERRSVFELNSLIFNH